ncbi:NADH dehydrogenase [ubiquinone] 1 beta subcomplex subunit 5, mitochondrial [Lingula anatina]|uniref:NADH dehydrogenase [ubiquinone] 1 beta subcomplex subunit 5, mitochondrial n=1 Tax=Lingula anatina TaxID=7574 RepID=A0A1S3JSU5_LINAN|nr:NADH dehydrogenase [ubiquinone] 1 beta subcomplex subunit 5, mitochondrial [Lingula anatina]|eukprot:XP_013413445.1 NADH dehydrogenase [ubiquinone] 1 beta subcomplex subunit 5, mitochondrial [Lingula anatina]
MAAIGRCAKLCLYRPQSSLLRQSLSLLPKSPEVQCARWGHGRVMNVRDGQYLTKALWNDMQFWFFVGFIPLTGIALYANIFVGEAKLEEIPEGYCPEEYEYFKHPISRWMVKYMFNPPEKVYERSLSVIYWTLKRDRERQLRKLVKYYQGTRGDQKGWYFIDAGLSQRIPWGREQYEYTLDNFY